MCCEEQHICAHCGYLISWHIDRCRFACSSRNHGTEIGIHADDWCPEGEWIVEEFMHSDDGACPKCSNTNLRVFPVDRLSGQVVHPPMTLPESTKAAAAAAGGRVDPAGVVSPSDSDASAASSGADDTKVARKSAGLVSGWRKRVRNMVNGTRLAGMTGKRKVPFEPFRRRP